MEKEAQHTGKTSPAFTQSQKRSFNVIPAIQKDIDLNGKLLHEIFDFIQVNRRNIQRDNGLLKWCIDMQLKVQQSEAANIIGRIVFRDCEEKLAMYDERDKLLIRTLNEFGCSIRFEDFFEEGWDFSACFSQHDDIDMTPEPAVVEALRREITMLKDNFERILPVFDHMIGHYADSRPIASEYKQPPPTSAPMSPMSPQSSKSTQAGGASPKRTEVPYGTPNTDGIWYGVKRGLNGCKLVTNSWSVCKTVTKDANDKPFPGADWKKFSNAAEAYVFIEI